MSTYYSILDVTDILYKEKSSKFIGYAYQVKTELEVKEKINEIKLLHPKATHHCYAYRLGLDKNKYRANDDGEPAGTAGKPILGQIDSLGITNCLVVVVRYYGGTKLGVSGLIEAYKETAKETLSSSSILEYYTSAYYKIEFEYPQLSRFYKTINKIKAHISEQKIENKCEFILSIEEEKKLTLESTLIEEQLAFEFLEIK